MTPSPLRERIRFIMKFLLSFAVLSPSLLRRNFVGAANDNATIEIYNPLTAFKQCSNGDIKWRICYGKFSNPDWYCPTDIELNASYIEDLGPCFTCPDAKSNCEKVVSVFLTGHNISKEATYSDGRGDIIGDELLSSCQELCEAGKKGDACSSDYYDSNGYRRDTCTPGSHFCDFASNEEFAMNVTGTCKACPLDRRECYLDGFVTSIEGKRNCAGCTLACLRQGMSSLIVNGSNIPSYPVYDAIQKPHQNASGPLIDCSTLLLESESKCPGAKGHVCIVDSSILRGAEVGKFDWQLSNVAENSGCVAIVLMGAFAWHSFDELAIPFVTVMEEQAMHFLKSEHNLVAEVVVQLFGSRCNPVYIDCNIGLPCSEGYHCSYYNEVVDGEFTEGHCETCPTFENGEPDPAGCFFDRADHGDNTLSFISAEAVESCARACNARLISDGCKFCPSEVSQFDFGVENKADQCYFCPSNDVQYPGKFVPLFGKNITCRMVQLFFNRMEVHKDSPNCRLVQSMNYMCGCNGTGYAGANTHMKRVLLVWLPRASAILSIAGSMFIIYDTLRTSKKRVKLMNQLLSTLSLFDIMGSSAYALTTLPTPKSDELYGAKGNEQTCTAQGFFIQIGTIACFLNVALALYYLLTIKYGWTEERFKRKRAACFLFIPPISVGLVYSFVGIRHYDNVRVWCNNSAKWWPEVPVILAIIAATGIMGSLCHHVYNIEKQTSQFANNGSRLSTKVFKQSCWFVAAFYITWVPYLTLQYMLSFGKGYNSYGLILSAATLVPLQGFWNNFVYIRPRHLSKISAHIFTSICRVSSSFQRSSKAATKQSVLNSLRQSREHDQLQVVQVYDTEVVSSRDEQLNNTNISKEN